MAWLQLRVLTRMCVLLPRHKRFLRNLKENFRFLNKSTSCSTIKTRLWTRAQRGAARNSARNHCETHFIIQSHPWTESQSFPPSRCGIFSISRRQRRSPNDDEPSKNVSESEKGRTKNSSFFLLINIKVFALAAPSSTRCPLFLRNYKKIIIFCVI